MKTLEQRIADLEAGQEQHATKIAQIEKGTDTNVSSVAKKPVEKPKVCTETATVKYKNRAGAEKTGKFTLKNPMVHYKGENIPAFEAIKNDEIMTYYVQETWVGNEAKCPFVTEVVEGV